MMSRSREKATWREKLAPFRAGVERRERRVVKRGKSVERHVLVESVHEEVRRRELRRREKSVDRAVQTEKMPAVLEHRRGKENVSKVASTMTAPKPITFEVLETSAKLQRQADRLMLTANLYAHQANRDAAVAGRVAATAVANRVRDEKIRRIQEARELQRIRFESRRDPDCFGDESDDC